MRRFGREATEVAAHAAGRYAEASRSFGEAAARASAALERLSDELRRPSDVPGLKALAKRGDGRAAAELARRGVYRRGGWAR